MKKREIKLKCLELALKTNSSSLTITEDELLEKANKFYNYINSKS